MNHEKTFKVVCVGEAVREFSKGHEAVRYLVKKTSPHTIKLYDPEGNLWLTKGFNHTPDLMGISTVSPTTLSR